MFPLPLHPSQITNHLLLGYISLSSVHSKSCLSCNLTNLTPSSTSISLSDWTPPQHLSPYLIGLLLNIHLPSVYSKSCLSCNLTNLTPSSTSISLSDWTPPQHLSPYLIGLGDLFLAVFFSLNSLTLLCESHLYLIPLTLTSWLFCSSQINPTHLTLSCHPMTQMSLI